jgi:hypothetical protein
LGEGISILLGSTASYLGEGAARFLAAQKINAGQNFGELQLERLNPIKFCH